MTLPQKPGLSSTSLALEVIHEHLREATWLVERVGKPPLDLGPVVASLQRSHAALYAAFDATEHPLEACLASRREMQEAVSGLAAAREEPMLECAVKELELAVQGLLELEGALAGVLWRAPPRAPDLRASQDVPRLHQVDRPRLVLTIRGAPPPVAPAAPLPELIPPEDLAEAQRFFEDLTQRSEARRKARELPPPPALQEEKAEAPPPGFAPDALPVLSEDEFIHSLARNAFDDVVMLGMHRTPLLDDPWRGGLVVEQRILAAIDALVCLGPRALEHLQDLTREWPIKDPARLFALTLVLGCVAGRDALALAERYFYEQEVTDPEYARAFASALKLVPHGSVELIAHRLFQDPGQGRRALGIDVLAYRGWASDDDLARAAADEPEVAAKALHYYALTGHPGVPEALDKATQRLLQEPPGAEFALATWLALAYAEHPRAPASMRAAAGGPHENLALLALAVTGHDRDAEFLLDLARQDLTRGRVEALGWAGAKEGIPLLLRALTLDDEEIRVTAAYALERMTQAGMWEEAEVAPEGMLEPSIPAPELGEDAPPPERPLFEPEEGAEMESLELTERPTTNVDRWMAYFADHATQYQDGKRYRCGSPYSPLVSWQELDTGRRTPHERRWLERELIVRTGGFVRVDPHDFVRVQEELLALWQPLAQAHSSRPGTWTLPTRKRDARPPASGST